MNMHWMDWSMVALAFAHINAMGVAARAVDDLARLWVKPMARHMSPPYGRTIRISFVSRLRSTIRKRRHPEMWNQRSDCQPAALVFM